MSDFESEQIDDPIDSGAVHRASNNIEEDQSVYNSAPNADSSPGAFNQHPPPRIIRGSVMEDVALTLAEMSSSAKQSQVDRKSVVATFTISLIDVIAMALYARANRKG